MKKYIIGIDVGGTNVKFGLIGVGGKIISRTYLKTKSFVQNKKILIEAIIGQVQQLISINHLKRQSILGIGCGLPGLINPSKGLVYLLPNIPGWRDVPFQRIMEQKLKISTFIENDVNLITLGEWTFGAGRGLRNLVCMTLGTGVGGGLVLDNALYRGEHFAAGEIGHMPLNENGPTCNCGGWGCFERYVGNRSLLKNASLIFGRDIPLEEIFRLANKGEKRALHFWEEAATHIGNGLVGLVNLLNPRLIIIGGGVSNNFKFLKEKIQMIIRKRAMPVQAETVKIVRAQLGDDAGIIGAEALVREFLGNS